MSFIEPLHLETWFTSVLAGTPEIFTIIALLFLAGMAGYFRLNGIGLFFMLGIFLLMFSGFIEISLLVFIAVIGSLIIGLTFSKMLNRIS